MKKPNLSEQSEEEKNKKSKKLKANKKPKTQETETPKLPGNVTHYPIGWMAREGCRTACPLQNC